MAQPEYELIYWPKLIGRGEFIRLVFEEAGTAYTDSSRQPDAIPHLISFTSTSNKGDARNPPVLACPILKHGDFYISQLPNILLYLGQQLGLVPDGAATHALFHMNAIALTLLEGLCDEAHDSHHPIASSIYYEEQKDEAARRTREYLSKRLPQFMTYIQRLLEAETSAQHGPWLYGEKLTYIDIVLFQCIDGVEYAFPSAVKRLRESGLYNAVFELHQAVMQRPRIKEYLASERRNKYGECIWRFYPDLQEEVLMK
ncbi:hypothetical protein CDD81_5801 [Ophiocordyceps australis]|uniref:Glutathione S-transferase n=1 Tax=Ophiocordyceps australis TaxID=1399860 RepID=A0A2C5Y7V2_9HYPO|nr:hypothetical protein CDD81_5801 [Ophiocordyceps australis]